MSLTLNNIIIESRVVDKFINATQLCQAGGKKFNNWYQLTSTKELIRELEKNLANSNAGIPALKLIDKKSWRKSFRLLDPPRFSSSISSMGQSILCYSSFSMD